MKTTKTNRERINYTWDGHKHYVLRRVGSETALCAVQRAIAGHAECRVDLLTEWSEGGEYRAVYHDGERLRRDVVFVTGRS